MSHLQQVRNRVRGWRRRKEGASAVVHEGVEAIHDLVLLLLRAGGGPLSSQGVVRGVRDSTVNDSLKFDTDIQLLEIPDNIARIAFASPI